MKHVVIFAGTTEGRNLATILDLAKVPLDICVATDYGEMVLPAFRGAHIHKGRMDQAQMEIFLTREPKPLVVDASHPFAREVSENIRAVTEKLDLDYLRLLRDEDSYLDRENVRIFAEIEEGADFLNCQEGNILLTTGSKDLKRISTHIDDLSRVYARVLPTEESIRLCHEAGLFGRQIIAMQGPVSRKMHQVSLEDLQIKWQMTKASGRIGGVEEKLAAAALSGVKTVMISRPPEQGYSFRQILRIMANRLGLGMELEREWEGLEARGCTASCPKIRRTKSDKRILHLISVGPGQENYLTEEARQALLDCQLIFGAKSILDRLQLPEDQARVAEYRPDYVQEYLDRRPEILIAGVVFSGDLGFFSGAAAYPGPLDANREPSYGLDWANWEVIRHSGISSLQYLAAKAGLAWDDANFISLHGREGDVLGQITRHEKNFLIFSSGDQVKSLAENIRMQGEKRTLILGYRLGSKEERVLFCGPDEAAAYDYEEGLWSAFVIGRNRPRPLMPVLEDSRFLRDRVPMTKEEVRHLSVLALGLEAGDILYDIGAGTGSISIEAAGFSPDIRVYAIEQKAEAVDLIRRNISKFGSGNIEVVEGRAPGAMEDLPAPDAVFIGGSDGSLRPIFEGLWRYGKPIRFVLNAITLETLSDYQKMAASLPICREKISLIQVSRARKVASYHMMTAENGVYIISGVLGQLES